MNDVKVSHPSPEELSAFVLARLNPDERAAIEDHVATCDSCCQVLREVPDDTLVGRLRNSATPRDAGSNTSPLGALAAAPVFPEELTGHPKYHVVRFLGSGGMGTVYEAEHRLMERSVALKLIKRSLTSDATAAERFRLEVKAAARLAHPNIVAAHDAEQAGDLHFLVMELIEGLNLAQLVAERGPPPVGEACEYVRQAALGLQHAFERGMIHRDIKPQNLMVTRFGQVKILDFGLARLARERSPAEGRPAGGSARDTASTLTHAGILLGTPDYIAPEQVSNSGDADIRADVYSLGCTFYFLLTGGAPFPLGSVQQKLSSHQDHEPPAVTERRRDVPAGVAAVVARMMAKDPAQRYQTPAEVAQALAPFARSESAPALQSESRGRRRFLATALLAGLLLVAAGFVLGPHFARDPGGPAAKQDDGSWPKGDAPPSIASGPPRVLFVLAPRDFYYPDFSPVNHELIKGGIEVVIGSSTLDPAVPDPQGPGEPVTPNVALKEARPADYDAVIFCGGRGVHEFLGDQPIAASARKLIVEMLAAGKYVTAVGMGVGVLADAGVLKGKRVTCYPYDSARWISQVKKAGAIWLDEPVIVDGRIITGRDPKDVREFGQVLVEKLLGESP